MFHLGVVAFRDSLDMSILRTIIAFFLFDDLKQLDPPRYPSFKEFKVDEMPTAKHLKDLITPCSLPFTFERTSKKALGRMIKQDLFKSRKPKSIMRTSVIVKLTTLSSFLSTNGRVQTRLFIEFSAKCINVADAIVASPTKVVDTVSKTSSFPATSKTYR